MNNTKSGKDSRKSGNHEAGHGTKHQKNAKHGHDHAHYSSKKTEDIVPWGWEAAAKEDRRKKAEQSAAAAAERKSAREFDPAMVVQQKVKKPQNDVKSNGKAFKAAPGAGANPNA